MMLNVFRVIDEQTAVAVECRLDEKDEGEG